MSNGYGIVMFPHVSWQPDLTIDCAEPFCGNKQMMMMMLVLMMMSR